MLEWGEIYNLGIAEIDEEHKVFFDLVERGQKILEHLDQDCLKEICTLIGDLEKFIKNHFKVEESFMKKIGYPDFLEHQLEHSIFEAQITGIETKIIEYNQEAYVLRMLDFIVEWFILHIGSEDQKLADYCLNKI